ncbi:MAG TPA: hypothetical protein VH619_13620 [Verrucomicrobiae bacterium]|jgi:hypothetical protein|nr:hypothetical protein [Verrucomicrobiae bacterium]
MKTKSSLWKAGKAGIAAGALLLGTLTVPAVYGDGGHADVNINIPVPSVTIGAPDNYVYYPKYGAYYSSARHQYYYRDHNAWKWGAAPPGVDRNVILGSPSVKMDFHDSPAHHHDEIVRKYPKNWTPDHSDRR